uniref:Type I polyketide synthase n=1 Tax=Gambierdiscus excentricus TaxID=986170 RepID=A0A1S6K825_9DINO|nr:type I polyketide synthase [Gambierdiscus excentricus]
MGSLEQLLVRIHDLDAPVQPEQLGESASQKPSLDVNGKVGRAVWWNDETAKYMVHLLEAVYVSVPEVNLERYDPPKAQDGGFDIVWPSHQESLPDFAWSMSEVLQKKGWCLIQMIVDEDVRKGAVKQVGEFTKFKALREEFVSDYLGHGGKGKVGFVDTEIPDPDRLSSLRSDALSLFDRNLTNLAAAAAPLTFDMMDFHFGDRTKGMLWTQFSSGKEEQTLKPERISEEDVDEGKVEEHIMFLQRRKLCCMTCLENEGGNITLMSRPDLNANHVVLPLAPRKILVFRSDRMTFRFEPVGRFAVLQSWILEEPPKLSALKIEGDVVSKAEAHGILKGRPYPEGDKVHVMSVMTRLPGDGFGPNEYWSMLLEGTDGEVPIPFLRWDVDLYCTKEGEPHQFGKAYAQHGGFCRHEQIFSFDNKFFDISDHEAKYMSPGQRVFAEDGYTVMYRAGHSRESINGQAIGVFIGDTGSDWTPFNVVEYDIDIGGGQMMRVGGPATTAITGGNNSVTVSRLMHLFNMTGPTGTADTACSSSLVATGVAMSWMRERRMAATMVHAESRIKESIAGGVCVQIGPGSYIAMCGLNMISPVGRCFTFDESGDGYARGEGTGLMFLRGSTEFEDTLEQNACILGCCINQDGRSASMTAPNGPSQQACIAASMREAELEARMINLAECHGTGTALGDPIEVGALRNAMEPRDFALCLTSSKSNIGHLEGGAGIAGLLKCILMLMAGTCPPNAHCRQLNPHLSVGGFPCFFDTEGIDTHLNSALTGVSSFGFGGTNGRCDIWGQARFGVNRCGELDVEELDQITVTCPVTLGPINSVTGEPALRPSGERKRYKADVLRDEFAPYDISRYAYTGGFRYRMTELPEEREEDLPSDVSPYICGSWSGFTEMEEMESQGNGWYLATVVLGESRCETFDLTLNRERSLSMYPAQHRATSKIWINGPDGGSDGRKWIIDGRDLEIPAGTTYRIHFRWSAERMEIFWEEASQTADATALSFEHTYYVAGTFSKWRCMALARGAKEGAWEGSFTIGSQGKEEFQFVRDRDWQQVVYPAKPKTAKPGVPVRGPDDLGKGKHFTVRGQPGETIQVELSIVDAKVAVRATSPTRGTVEWHSLEGWERHEYSAVGSFNEGVPLPMSMDLMKPGIFKCRVKVGDSFYPEYNAFLELFQVTVDDDVQHTFYPDKNLSRSGEAIVRGPDSGGSDKNFLVRSLLPYKAFEIVLDLTAEDRRRVVTWSWVSDELEDGSST